MILVDPLRSLRSHNLNWLGVLCGKNTMRLFGNGTSRVMKNSHQTEDRTASPDPSRFKRRAGKTPRRPRGSLKSARINRLKCFGALSGFLFSASCEGRDLCGAKDGTRCLIHAAKYDSHFQSSRKQYHFVRIPHPCTLHQFDIDTIRVR
jgi:hypothetical protein